MRADRLYGITLYLMNHGRTSAAELAKRFEVSVRTIQRDIDALCSAGIPVAAVTGVKGGYEIMESFTLQNQLLSPEDYRYILTGLKGLSTAADNPRVDRIREKISTLAEENSGMVLDFSVLREGKEGLLQKLQTAVAGKKTVKFIYTNGRNETRAHTVEPITLLYRWYAWYLLAYSTEKKDYRTYKLLRMEDLEITEQGFTREHSPAEVILAEHDKDSQVKPTTVTVKCDPKLITRAFEYLNGRVIRYLEDQSAIMELTVVESEQLWLGTLLSFGDQVEILAPEHIRQRVLHCAEKIVSLYQKL